MNSVLKSAMIALVAVAVSCSAENKQGTVPSCTDTAALTQDAGMVMDENGCPVPGGAPAVQPATNTTQAGGARPAPVLNPPPAPTAPANAQGPDPVTPTLTATQGGTVATIAISASPGDLAGIVKADIRKLAGTAAPADCNDGDLLHSASTGFGSITTSDNSWPGEPQSYRACFYGNAGLLGEAVAENILPRAHHTIFVTSESYSGNLKAGAYDHPGSFANGKEGADYRCQHLASAAGHSGTWKALLTASSSSAAQKAYSHKIYGAVYNNKPEKQKVAENHSVLWSGGSLLADLNADEHGNAAAGDVWTGTSAQGSYYYSCGNFTSGSGSGYYGQPVETDGDWTLKASVTCSQKRHLYCIDSAPSSLSVAVASAFQTTAGSNPGDIDVEVDLPDDTSKYGSVKIFALDGNQDSIQEYTCDNPNFHERAVKIYTAADSDAFPAPEDDAFTYAHGSDGYYSYRLCAWDIYGNLISEVKVPAVLSGSDNFNRIFVVNGLDGNLGGVAGADAICQNAADNAGLTGQWPAWKAVISATGVNAKTRLTLTDKIYVVGGLQLYAADADEMFSLNGPKAGIWHDATGSFAGSTDAWTGAAADGTPEANNCQDWTSNSNMDEGRVGYADVYGSSNLSISYNSCDKASLGGLICISSP